MMLLFSLFALSARGAQPSCFGKKSFDEMGCVLRNPTICEDSGKCHYGANSPKNVMGAKMEKCMGDQGKTIGQGCTEHTDCAPECMNMCIDGQCKGCRQMSGKDACMNAVLEGLKCRWSGGMEMGMCVEEGRCYGKEPKFHYGCKIREYDTIKCAQNSLCDYGFDPYDKQKDDYEACAQEGGFQFKKCETVADCTQNCSTGQMCWDMGFSKACAGCADLGTEDDCKVGADNGLKCVWTGFMGAGMCIADMREPEVEMSVSPTLSPVEATPAPVAEGTPAPVVEVTPAPVAEISVSPSLSPVEATPAPVAVTDMPTIIPTKMPVEATPAPVAEISVSPSLSPVEVTPAPVAEISVSPSLSPVAEGTPAPVVEVTPAPVAETDMPTIIPTKMPVTPTKMPTEVDACMGLSSKACKKNPDCDYADDKCSLNYTPECVSKRGVDLQFKCQGMMNKKDCLAVKPPIGSPTCTWGRNEIDLDVKVKECMEKNEVDISEPCEKDSDCKCGNKCFDFGFSKVCSTCRDMGNEDDCDELTEKHSITCKFVGGTNDGLCLQVDPCRAHSLDQAECKKVSICAFADSKCAMQVAGKKVCKKRGKNKLMTLEQRGEDCQAITGCKWSVKTKGKKTKTKCKFQKKN